jgi:hypothetical protein
MVRIHPDPPGESRLSGSGKAQGAVAQLGERLLCKQEVIGSIPFSSTISIDCRQRSTFAVGFSDER